MKQGTRSLLDLRSVSFSYVTNGQSLEVLRDVGLSIIEGEVISIVGKSGVGKSTLLRIMAQQLLPDLGEVATPEESAERLSVLYQPQTARLLPWQSLHDNVVLGLRFTGMPATESVAVLLDLFDLGTRMHASPAQLSGGQIERATLARTLLTPASVYLLDEPLSGTDYPLRLELESYLIGFLKRHSAAAIVVTHDIPQALAISHRILLLCANDGVATHELIAVPEYLSALDPVARRTNPNFGQTVQQIVDRMGGGR